MSDTAFIPEEEVTVQRIEALFKRAFYETYYDKDNDLVVKVDGSRTFIRVREKSKVIAFTVIYGFKPEATREQKLDVVNAMNDAKIFARFSMMLADESILLTDYFLPFDDGVGEMQIISSARMLISTIRSAFEELSKDLIE